MPITEATVQLDEIPQTLLNRYFGREYIYNPFVDRQVHFYSSAIPRKDIAKGEELFDNYLGMVGKSVEGWAEDVAGLKRQCAGGIGIVKEWDLEHESISL